MDLIIFEVNKQKIAEIISEGIVINKTQDVLDIIGNAGYQGAGSVILKEDHLRPEFFDLRSGMAGEILQKFSNYRMKLAIIGEFEKFKSKSLKAFISESNRGNQIFFVSDRDTAITRLVG